MAGRDEPSGKAADPDDWFAAGGSRPPAPPGRPAGTRTAGPADDEEWLEGDTREAAAPSAAPAGLPRGRFALLGVAAFVVIVVIAFAAAGVFSGGKKSSSPPPTTTTNPQTTTQQTPTTPSTPTTTPTISTVPTLTSGLLKQGTSGPDVKALQQALASAGHDPGTIDGDFGPKTEQALIAFQQSAGVPADGVYGPQTKAALEKKLRTG